MTKIIVFAIIAVGILAFFMKFEPSPEANARQFQRDKIAFCWKDQARKSLDPAAARFVASVCEKLESEFVTEFKQNP